MNVWVMTNEDILILNNDYKLPMINGEVSPVLGNYEEFPDLNTSIQFAEAWIE